MSSAAAVTHVEDKLRWMVNKEMRGPGDGGNALERIIYRYRLNGSAIRAVLYRKPADIYLSVFLSISAAYEAEARAGKEPSNMNEQSRERRPGLARRFCAWLIRWTVRKSRRL